MMLPQDCDVTAALFAAFGVAILTSYVFRAAFFLSISRSLQSFLCIVEGSGQERRVCAR